VSGLTRHLKTTPLLMMRTRTLEYVVDYCKQRADKPPSKSTPEEPNSEADDDTKIKEKLVEVLQRVVVRMDTLVVTAFSITRSSICQYLLFHPINRLELLISRHSGTDFDPSYRLPSFLLTPRSPHVSRVLTRSSWRTSRPG
jgi:hypothetical protein